MAGDVPQGMLWMLGDQTNLALVAPSSTNKVRMCLHAAMLFWGVLPLTVPHHGYQLPFISWNGRSHTGPPYAFTSCAYLRKYASMLPEVIASMLYCGWLTPLPGFHTSSVMSGMTPRDRELAASDALNGEPTFV